MDGRKMAKSAGNFQRVTELVDRGLDPLAFRYLVLTSRYSRKLEYSDRSLDAAAAALGSLRAGLRALGEPPTDGPWAAPAALRGGRCRRPPGRHRHGSRGPWHRARSRRRSRSPTVPRRRPLPCPTAGRALHERFVAAIDDDLDMPVALALLREILRAPLPADERRWLILDADEVLGLDLHRVWETDTAADEGDAVPDGIQALRRRARPPPGPSATGRAPMRSVTSSRRPAGSSSTVPRAADSNDAGLRRPASIRRCDGHRSRPS